MAAPAVVNSNKAQGNGVSSQGVVANWAQTAGNTMVVFVFGWARTPANGDVTDTKGNTYTLRPAGNGTNIHVACFEAHNIVAATINSNTVTYAPTGAAQDTDIIIYEISPADTSAPLDQSGSHVQNTGTGTYDCGTTGTTSLADELAFAAASAEGNNAVPTAPTGYTLGQHIETTANVPAMVAYKTLSATGTEHPIFTNVNIFNNAGVVATYKAAYSALPDTGPSPIGFFDPMMVLKSWFDPMLDILAWFDQELLKLPTNVVYPLTLTVATSTTPQVVRQAQKPLKVSSTSGATVVKQARKTRTVSVGHVSSIVKRAARTLTITVSAGHTVAKRVQRSLARVAVTSTANVQRRAGKALKPSISVAVQAVKRQAGKALRVSVTGAPTLGKQARRTLLRAVTVVKSVPTWPTVHKQVQKALIVEIAAGPGFRGVNVAPLIVRQVGRVLSSTATGSALVVRQARKALSVSGSVTPTARKQARKPLGTSVTTTASVVLRRVFLRTFSVAVNTLTSITRGSPPWHLRVGFTTTKHMKSNVSVRVHVAQPPDLFTKRVVRRFTLQKANVNTILGGGPYIQKRAARRFAPLPVAASASVVRQLGKVLLRPVGVVVSLVRQYIPTVVGQKGSVGISDRGSGGLSVSDRAFQGLAESDRAVGGLSVLDRGAGSATAADEAGELVSVSDR